MLTAIIALILFSGIYDCNRSVKFLPNLDNHMKRYVPYIVAKTIKEQPLDFWVGLGCLVIHVHVDPQSINNIERADPIRMLDKEVHISSL